MRGAFRSGYLGYYAFAGHERRGRMKQALRAAVRRPFGALQMHGLEANIQPENRRFARAGPVLRLAAGRILAVLSQDRRPLQRP